MVNTFPVLTTQETIDGYHYFSDMTITPTTPEPVAEPQADERPVDDKDKKQAKARAKVILQGRNADDVLDARPDDKLMEKVEQEIAQSSDETDLLNNNSPQEQ